MTGVQTCALPILIKQFKNNKDNRVLLIEKEIITTHKEINKLKIKDHGPKLLEEEHQLNVIEEDVDKRHKLQTQLNESVSNRDSRLLKIGEISRVCDKCGALSSKDQMKDQEDKLRADNFRERRNITKLKKKIEALDYTEDDLEKQEELISSIEKKIYKNKLNKKQRASLIKKQEQRKKQIEDINKETLDEKVLSRLKKDKKGLRGKINKLKDDRKIYENDYDILTWCIKEPLSNKGLKAYIFDSQLLEVNKRLDALGELLPFKIEFGIDTDTKSKKFYTLVEHSGGIVPYEDLSGGEQQLVNIAIAFSIHDVVSSDVNAIFMDEVFESLDKTNIEIVGDLILQKAEKKEVLLVTHTSFYPTGAEIIHYSKSSKGITKIS